MGSEDLDMTGGGSSQRVDIGLNSLSGRSVQPDEYSRSIPGPKRIDPVKKSRTGEGFGDYADPQKFNGSQRPGFLQSSERDYREVGDGFHRDHNHRVLKDSVGDGDERKSLYGAGHGVVGREQEWAGGDRGAGSNGDYRDIGVVRGEASEVSPSEGTEDEDEDDGDMGGDREGVVGERAQEMILDEGGIPVPPLENRTRQDSRVVEGFPRPGTDRERVMKPPTSSSTMFLQPSPPVAGLTYLNYATSSPSGSQMATHVDSNVAQNGGVGAGGVGQSMPTSYGIREGGISRDSYAKSLAERDNSIGGLLHEQQSQGHLHEGLQASEENYYTSLLNSGTNSGAQKVHDLGHDVVNPGPKRSMRMMDSLSPAELSLRRILSDPLSGQLMEDATIFPCGHSFGKASLQQIMLTNVCLTCGASVRTSSMAPNLALQAAVQAFKQEEESLALPKSAKRRRDRHDQDHGILSEQHASDGSRPKGVQFPFAVSDQVLIKGNKRTPERFVGREAVITNQCLNGWYLVRTSDNGESVRLQYRSLQKLGGQPSPSASHFGPGWRQ